jgi:hypothetical protein
MLCSKTCLSCETWGIWQTSAKCSTNKSSFTRISGHHVHLYVSDDEWGYFHHLGALDSSFVLLWSVWSPSLWTHVLATTDTELDRFPWTLRTVSLSGRTFLWTVGRYEIAPDMLPTSLLWISRISLTQQRRLFRYVSACSRWLFTTQKTYVSLIPLFWQQFVRHSHHQHKQYIPQIHITNRWNLEMIFSTAVWSSSIV